jgi:hypothetical protein
MRVASAGNRQIDPGTIARRHHNLGGRRMRVALPDWPTLGVFIGLVLAITLYGLALSIHFPSEHRRPSLKGGLGSVVLWGTTAIVIAAAVLAVRLVFAALPLYVAVIAGGAAVLVAPPLLKPLPDRLIDDRGGLMLFAGLAALLALISLNY